VVKLIKQSLTAVLFNEAALSILERQVASNATRKLVKNSGIRRKGSENQVLKQQPTPK